ncbi:MAG: YdcF family protein [Parcubacteria group bacterium CG_4_9_14_0_2_um_filter_41_8]|nr:MAG: hypothetical protein AUJ34_01380 [Parcubacteria group bacterium CG1_02_41_12]PIP67408.1 MAG: hypothetical protein COW93_00270 [Parcubacteria group bacterium CG22_combo_CG10-13_8_21_14_all_41_9]PIQ78336.1 MAG: hypothetical protein COV79_05370 [Parcubacteria group bacterium CG11_big_fil_rev_8_21_14_0_20_41_14]PIR57438.1 MAG: YdcF family protein [Parcubacteria group bacterium CG10_big_fil_rev_8_21_14_0_10_41_35]PIZ81403.1 MAG: YdcF family protein [Parcubacteria group bacterium CG_4_10_14_0
MNKKYSFLKILSIFAAILFALFLLLFSSIFVHSFSDNAKKADSIVVLGAAQWDMDPSPMFQARLDHAFDLYKAGYAPSIILTGGFRQGEEVSEADVGAYYLHSKGVLPGALFVDSHGKTTFESLNSVANLLSDLNIGPVILVSHDFHNMRLSKMAEDIGINAVVSPVRSKNFFSKIHYMLRETVVYIAYFLFEI